jgi:hypothetical protein
MVENKQKGGEMLAGRTVLILQQVVGIVADRTREQLLRTVATRKAVRMVAGRTGEKTLTIVVRRT